MDATPRLQLPYIAPQQAQKQVTYNEAMQALDQLVQPVVLSRSTGAPPADPAAGDCYLVGPAASGAWTGQEGRLVGDDGKLVEAEPVETKAARTHWDMLLERRTRAELEEILQERLEYLRARRGEKSSKGA